MLRALWRAIGPFGAACNAAISERTRRPRVLVQGQVREPQLIFDVAVIGGGLVGLAVAREASARGHSVVLLERESALAASASGGNAGLGHTGYDAPEGSLERRLLRRAASLHQGLYRSFGLNSCHVRKCGSLVVAWTPEQLEKLDDVFQLNIAAGDMDVYQVSGEELRILEPSLSASALGAVVCPNEAVVEPWLITIGFAESAVRHGAELRLSTEVTSVRRVDGKWCIGTGRSPVRSGGGQSTLGEVLVRPAIEAASPVESDIVLSRFVVNCAGLFGDRLERMRLGGGEPPYHVTPRKGQYLVMKSKDVGLNHIIETLPTHFTKGVIVWSTVYGNVIVGPTATDQDSRTDRSTDEATISTLQEWAVKVVPALCDATVVGTYSGLRVATEFRDYCIQSHPIDRWVGVGGIRSTGLSSCPAIGEYVVDLIEEIDNGTQPPERPMLGVSVAKESLQAPRSRVGNGIVPSLAELSAEYRANCDGTVTIYGRRWHVAHPLSCFGMSTYTGTEAGVTS